MTDAAKKEIMQRSSPFARAFKALLDDTGFFTRPEWARFLGIPETSLSAVVNDEAAPRADLLGMVLDVLHHSSDIPPGPLTEFDRIARLPADEVSPCGKWMAPTIAEYLRTSTLGEFGRRLRPLTPEQQIRVLGEGLWPKPG